MSYFRHRGHRIDVDLAAVTVTYEDGVSYDDEERACTACGRCAPNQRAPDPCLGKIPGVMAACCGHGLVNSCYVAPRNGRALAGHDAARWFAEHGRVVPPLADDDDPAIEDQLQLRSFAWLTQGAAIFRESMVVATEAARAFVAATAALADPT